MDSHPQRELRGPQLPFPGTGTVISAENRAIIESSTRVIERTNAAPSRTADWGTMASPMGPIVVDSDAPPSLGGLPEPQVSKNLFAAGPISPIVARGFAPRPSDPVLPQAAPMCQCARGPCVRLAQVCSATVCSAGGWLLMPRLPPGAGVGC